MKSVPLPPGCRHGRLLVLAIAGLALLTLPSAAAPSADLQQVKQQISQQLHAPAPTEKSDPNPQRDPANITRWMKSLRPDGRWPDINYADNTRSSWSAAKHPERLLTMAKAYVSPDDPHYADAALGKTIHTALGHWLEHDYLNPNWWHNQIGVPRNIGFTLLLLEPELTPEELQAGLKILERSTIKMTGQNRVWLAGNVLMRALLQNDADLARQARDVINSEFVVSADEGLQVDHSFHQHGPQLQLGNYGLAFANDGVTWLQNLRGTALALDEDKVRLLRDYLLQGLSPVVWRARMDISSCARQLTPHSPAAKARSVARLLTAMQTSDPDHAAAYREALRVQMIEDGEKNPLTGNRLFWRSDYLVDRRADYCASVKMSSARTIGSEVVNEENLSGRHLGDGALYVYKTGREYENIFPVWDWHRLPGVTSATDGPLRPGKERNAGTFVGGVSDGDLGVAVLDYDRDALRARKSWFFLDGQIVCLGAGIGTAADTTVTTGINQCLLNGPVLVAEPGRSEGRELDGRRDFAALGWAWHDDVGYVFLEPAPVTAGGLAQTGSWAKNVHAAGSSAPVSRDVFSIWINHGAKPHGAGYAYVILPAATAARVQAYAAAPDTEILANTPRLQAVRHGPTTAAVFFEAGRLAYAENRSIAVDQPCVLLLTETSDGPRLTVADPTQKLTRLTIPQDGKPVEVRLPGGAEAGSGVTVR